LLVVHIADDSLSAGIDVDVLDSNIPLATASAFPFL